MVVQAFRGRERETARAVEVLERARVEGQGAILAITGEPGIGKSALLEVIRERALTLGYAVGFGKADVTSQIAPGAPVLMALRSGPHPLLDDIGFRSLAPLSDKAIWLVDQIAELLERRAQRSPVLVALDDLQWADPLSLFALRVLSGRLVGSPVVWALAQRGDPDVCTVGFPLEGAFEGVAVERLQLGPLPEVDLLGIAADILGAPVSDGAASTLRRVGGNPFLAVQFAQGMLREQRQQPMTLVPPALAEALRSRTSRLDPATLDLLQLAAVWGRPLEINTAIALLAPAPPRTVRSASRDAMAAGLLEPPGEPVQFQHDLLRELVYSDIAEPLRLALHRRCAEFILANGDSALRAVTHARPGARLGDRDAVQILRAAAAECLASMPQTAADLAREAFVGLSDDDPSWSDVGEETAVILLEAQRGAEVVSMVDMLLARPHSVAFDARLQVLAARALWLLGLFDEMAVRTSQTLVHSELPAVLRSRLEASRSLALSRIGPTSTALASATSVLAEGRRLADRATVLIALQTLGEIAKNEGRHLAAYQHFHELRTLVGTRYLPEEVAGLQFLDRFDEAEELLLTVSASMAEDSGTDLPSLVCAQLWQDFKLGRFEAAVADAQTLIRIGDELGNYLHRLDARVVWSTIAVVHDDLDLAREQIDLAEREAATDDSVQLPGLMLAQARIAAAEGDLQRGVAILKGLIASESAANTYWPRLLDQMRLYAGLALAAGDRQLAEEAVELAARGADRNRGVDSFRGVALQVRGLVHRDPAALAAAVEALRRSPRPFMLASALSDHGTLLLQTGARAQGIRVLQEALSIFDRLDAKQSVADVQQALHGAGARSRGQSRSKPRPTFGWASLTDSEVRVAQLVSAGHTNRAVAARLGVSTSTVGTHLRSVFIKMDVQSRVQLSNAVRDHLGPDRPVTNPPR